MRIMLTLAALALSESLPAQADGPMRIRLRAREHYEILTIKAL